MRNTIQNLYDAYSPMIYGIALDISTTKEVAEEIFINTFLKIETLKLSQQNNTSLCARLIKLVFQTAHEHPYPEQLKKDFKLKYFEKMPLMQKFICGQESVDVFCEANKLSRPEVAKKIQEEFVLFRDFEKSVRFSV